MERARVGIIGSGAREHTLGWLMSQSPYVGEVIGLPGNPGFEAIGRNIPVNLKDFDNIFRAVADERIDFVVVGPEEPLIHGLVDAAEREFRSQRSFKPRFFGPTAAAAQLEGSKIFGMQITSEAAPHACPKFWVYREGEQKQALELIKAEGVQNVVIKADGPCAGKGVELPNTWQEAQVSVEGMMSGEKFGKAGKNILVQQRLEGQELSMMFVTDGIDVKRLPASQDHKRIKDGDLGPNTGGMGAYAPVPFVSEELADYIEEAIAVPIIREMAGSGWPYRGVLYTGLMLTKDGPKVLEHNCRFGDPETQVVAQLLESDLYLLLRAAAKGYLDFVDVRFSNQSAACVVLASPGYPGTPQAGEVIGGLENGSEFGVNIFQAGTKRKEDGRLITAGGRVLSATAVRPTLPTALRDIYRWIDTPGNGFLGAQFRRDIGHQALAYLLASKSPA